MDEPDSIDRPYTDFSSRELEQLITIFNQGAIGDLQRLLEKNGPRDSYGELMVFDIDLARVYSRSFHPISKETGEVLESNAVMEPLPVEEREGVVPIREFIPVTKARLAIILGDIKQKIDLSDDLQNRIDEMCNTFSISQANKIRY